MTNCTTSDLKGYVDYLLCYGYSNRIMKFISYLGQLSLMLGNDIVKVLHELKFILFDIYILHVSSHQSDQTLMFEYQIIKPLSRILFNLIFILCLFVVI